MRDSGIGTVSNSFCLGKLTRYVCSEATDDLNMTCVTQAVRCKPMSGLMAQTFCSRWNRRCGSSSLGEGCVEDERGCGLTPDSGRGEAALETTEAGEAAGSGLVLAFFFGASLEEESASAVALPLPSGWAWAPEGSREGGAEEPGFKPCKVSMPALEAPGVRGVTGVAGVAVVAERAAEGIAEPPAGAV